MGCDFYIETHVHIVFKDAAKPSELVLLSVNQSWADDLVDGQILNKQIIYINNDWVNGIYYNPIHFSHIELSEVETMEEIISVRERF